MHAATLCRPSTRACGRDKPVSRVVEMPCSRSRTLSSRDASSAKPDLRATTETRALRTPALSTSDEGMSTTSSLSREETLTPLGADPLFGGATGPDSFFWNQAIGGDLRRIIARTPAHCQMG